MPLKLNSIPFNVFDVSLLGAAPGKRKLMILIISWSWRAYRCAYPLYLRHSTALISRVLSFSRSIRVFSSQSHVHACVISFMSAAGKRAQFCLYCASLMSSLSRCYWTDVANPLARTCPIRFHLQSNGVCAGRCSLLQLPAHTRHSIYFTYIHSV